MKIRLLVPCLVILVGLSGCIPGASPLQNIVALLNFVLNPATDTFNCFASGDFFAEFDVVFHQTGPDSGTIEFKQRNQRSLQLVVGKITWPREAISPIFTYSLSGSGTHGATSFTEGYELSTNGLITTGTYWLMQEGCGTVVWDVSGELSEPLIVSSAEEAPSP